MTSYLLRKTFGIGRTSSGIPYCSGLGEPETVAKTKEGVVDAIKKDICAEGKYQAVWFSQHFTMNLHQGLGRWHNQLPLLTDVVDIKQCGLASILQ